MPELTPLAESVADLLKKRGEKIAVLASSLVLTLWSWRVSVFEKAAGLQEDVGLVTEGP